MVPGSYFIRTFGCQMNEADSELLAGILEARGFNPVAEPRQAEILLVNTCTIRQKAADKAYSELGRCLGLRRRGATLPLVVAAGCVARMDGERLLRRLPGLDVVLGPSRLGLLGELIERRLATGKPVVDVADEPALPGEPRTGGERRVSAFLTIMRGCDNRCSYCVVPSVRGPESSRPPADILAEARALADRGCREVTLLGQNVNSYGKGLPVPVDFPGLLALLDRESGLSRIRFTTSHPRDFTPALARALGELPTVCESLHLPVQSGSDRVLEAMNRGYTSAMYREKVRLLREAVPSVLLTTDIIVGHPGETQRDFEATFRLVEETGFAGLFAFKFSPREGTPAADLPDEVPPAEKDRRLQRILALQAGITDDLLGGLVGSEQEVLVEGTSRTDAGRMTGRTRGNLVVNLTGGEGLQGEIVRVRIERAGRHSLLGERVASS